RPDPARAVALRRPQRLGHEAQAGRAAGGVRVHLVEVRRRQPALHEPHQLLVIETARAYPCAGVYHRCGGAVLAWAMRGAPLGHLLPRAPGEEEAASLARCLRELLGAGQAAFPQVALEEEEFVL